MILPLAARTVGRVSNTVKRLQKFSLKMIGIKGDESPGAQAMTPTPPTIDDARGNRDMVDRLRRRRGVFANIFGGASSGSSAPSVGVKTLLGQ